MTKAELLSRMSAAEITEWRAYYKIQADEANIRQLNARAAQNLQNNKRYLDG